MIKMLLSDFRAAVSLAEIVEYREDYTGSGMYSNAETCPAIVGTPTDLMYFILFLDQESRVRNGDVAVSDLAYDLSTKVRMDLMGVDAIYYWPNLELVDTL